MDRASESFELGSECGEKRSTLMQKSFSLSISPLVRTVEKVKRTIEEGNSTMDMKKQNWEHTGRAKSLHVGTLYMDLCIASRIDNNTLRCVICAQYMVFRHLPPRY